MRKEELAEIVVKATNRRITKSRAIKVIDHIVGAIHRELNVEGQSRVHGLGLLKVIEVPPKNYRDPSTGEMGTSYEHRVVKLYPDERLQRIADTAQKATKIKRRSKAKAGTSH